MADTQSDDIEILDAAGDAPGEAAANVLVYVVNAPGERLDRFLARSVPDVSRSRLKEIILQGHVSVEGASSRDPSRKLKPGEAVTVSLPPVADAMPQAENIPLTIVFEDADVIVIDKPAGMVVHPAAGHHTGTLVNALLYHCGDTLSGVGGVRRPGIVHRLDKDTSGLMVVAKNDRAHQHLAAQFADHGRTGPLERAYKAFVWGVPSRAGGTIEGALDRSSSNREKMAVVVEGKGREAITHFSVEASFLTPQGEVIASMLECQLETGRTHQIRVHMAHIGHPLLGDGLYGGGFFTKANVLGMKARAALAALGRQALHAAVLGFEHPATGDTLHFESALPADMGALLAALTAAE